ncbi:hypothetical protein ID850_06480 [Xenorhabdus sp. Flor]|uniref:LCI fold-containing protein n=1 Tax=Xenorhabdus cabanillasii TaxID=351673 RepID=UPI0019BCD0E1|nr:LCI fold-containing protein [Xenorhabdus sp. Flor]MBD2814414.1 hypothetical protein [Xenorhabdus sp. Flor]
MFKKLLTVGALSAALIGGIGTASATSSMTQLVKCPSQSVYDNGGGKYFRYVVNPHDNFANVFSDSGYTWYFRSSLGQCEFHTGRPAFYAEYEGVRN